MAQLEHQLFLLKVGSFPLVKKLILSYYQMHIDRVTGLPNHFTPYAPVYVQLTIWKSICLIVVSARRFQEWDDYILCRLEWVIPSRCLSISPHFPTASGKYTSKFTDRGTFTTAPVESLSDTCSDVKDLPRWEGSVKLMLTPQSPEVKLGELLKLTYTILDKIQVTSNQSGSSTTWREGPEQKQGPRCLFGEHNNCVTFYFRQWNQDDNYMQCTETIYMQPKSLKPISMATINPSWLLDYHGMATDHRAAIHKVATLKSSICAQDIQIPPEKVF